MELRLKFLILQIALVISFFSNFLALADNHNIYETLETIQKDIKTLEKAVYSGSIKISDNNSSSSNSELDINSEDVLTRHLLKLSEIENQFQLLTNKFEEINFKLDKLSNRLSKVQADNQLRFQDIEGTLSSDENLKKITKKIDDKNKNKEILPGSSQPQDLGSISYKDSTTNEATQKIQSIDTTATIVTETFQAEEKILPNESAEKQYEFATSFLKVGDYSTAERAFREFVQTNPEHKLAGNAQYWYAETFRIRQLYTDAASAYLEGYQKYPKGEKAPVNLLKLGVSMVQIGEKDQGCKMINGVEKQYPKANQSVIQKAKYESQKFEKYLNIDENFIVAVSGGPDSLSLAFLAKIYSIKNNLVSKFFIVDHKLRKESTKEAKLVKKILKKNHIEASILTWKGSKPIKKIQSLAREKRFQLLFTECEKYNIKNVLLGHHQDDLVENFFIRMLRGSGLKGLISLDKRSEIDKKTLIRPLLNQKKKDLEFLSKQVFNFYVNDPSNKNEEFKRVRIRNFINELKKDGLDFSKFLNTIRNLQYSNSVVDFYVSENIKENSYYSQKSNKTFVNNFFFQKPDEVIFRSLSSLIKIIGKKHNFVRGKKLSQTIKKIRENSFSKSTLGGCVLEKVNDTLIIEKEA